MHNIWGNVGYDRIDVSIYSPQVSNIKMCVPRIFKRRRSVNPYICRSFLIRETRRRRRNAVHLMTSPRETFAEAAREYGGTINVRRVRITGK